MATSLKVTIDIFSSAFVGSRIWYMVDFNMQRNVSKSIGNGRRYFPGNEQGINCYKILAKALCIKRTCRNWIYHECSLHWMSHIIAEVCPKSVHSTQPAKSKVSKTVFSNLWIICLYLESNENLENVHIWYPLLRE